METIWYMDIMKNHTQPDVARHTMMLQIVWSQNCMWRETTYWGLLDSMFYGGIIINLLKVVSLIHSFTQELSTIMLSRQSNAERFKLVIKKLDIWTSNILHSEHQQCKATCVYFTVVRKAN